MLANVRWKYSSTDFLLLIKKPDLHREIINYVNILHGVNLVACDLPFVNVACIEHLFWNFESNSIATCYKNETAGFPEALCAIYTPAAKDIIFNSYFAGTTCPVKVLKNNSANSVAIPKDVNLANINLKVEWEKMQNEIN